MKVANLLQDLLLFFRSENFQEYSLVVQLECFMTQMPIVSRACAIHALMLFTGNRYKNLDGQDAVVHIVQNTDVEDRVFIASFAVASLLRLDELRNERSMFRSHDALDLALTLSDEVVIDVGVAESLVAAAAKAGFIGRFPEITMRQLKRTVSKSDIEALVSAYVGDKSTRAKHTEQKLIDMASTYLCSEDARIQMAKIEEFVRDWESGIDF